MRAALRAREDVRAAYVGRKPVMGSSDDNYTGHALAIAGAKLSAIREIVGGGWDERYLQLEDENVADHMKLEGVVTVLDMTGEDL